MSPRLGLFVTQQRVIRRSLAASPGCLGQVHNQALAERFRALAQVTQKKPGPKFYSALLPESHLSAPVMDDHDVDLLTSVPASSDHNTQIFMGQPCPPTLHLVPEFSGADSAPRSRDGHSTQAGALRTSEGQPQDLGSNS